jgi:hypothetical protein
VLVFLWACSSEKSGEVTSDALDDYDYTTEIIDGVKTITNPVDSFKGRIAMDMVEEVTIGVDLGEEPYMLVGPVDVKADAAGRIYIMDWRDVGLRVYDKDGVYIRTIGRKGQGPAEFDSPTFFDISDDGRIFLMDGRNQRITVMDIEGNYLKDFKVHGYHSGMVCDARNRIYVQTQKSMKEVAVSDDLQVIPILTSIFRVDPDTGDRFQLGDFEGDESRMRRTSTGGMASVGGSAFGWTVHPGGKLFLCITKDYQLSAYSENGDLEFRFSREYIPVPNPRSRSADNKYFPPFDPRRPRFDEEGNLWLQLYAPEDFEGILYDVFTPEGIYLKQVVVPYRIYFFKHGKVYSLLRTEDEFLQVKRSRLVEKPADGDGSK